MTTKTKRKPRAKAKAVTLHVGEQVFAGLSTPEPVENAPPLPVSLLSTPATPLPQAFSFLPRPHADNRWGTVNLDRPAWLMWWYRWRFRCSLARTSGYHAAQRGWYMQPAAQRGWYMQPGWRRRCLDAVLTGKITGTNEKRGRTEKEAVEAATVAVQRRVLPIVRFWRSLTGGWLDNVA